MKYAIIGSGAMGLRYGLTLKAAGNSVDFIDSWPPQVKTINRQGGVYVSYNGQNRHLVPISVSYPKDYSGAAQILVFFVKQYQLKKVLKLCSPWFNSSQYVLTAMNGMGHLEKFQHYFAKSKILAGTALIGTVLKKPGEIDFMGKKGSESMNLVSPSAKPDAITTQVFSDLKQAGLHPKLQTNLAGTLMGKFMINAVSNSLCTLFQIRLGEFISSPVAKNLGEPLVGEMFDVAERAGIKLLTPRRQEWQIIADSCRSLPLHYPSMYQDLIKHRKTEVDYLNGYIYDLGLKYHYQASLNNFLRNLVHLAEFNGNFDTQKFIQQTLKKHI